MLYPPLLLPPFAICSHDRNMKHLSESCLVVDALGATARRELLEEFVVQQLLPYEGLFGQVKSLALVMYFTLPQCLVYLTC